MRKHQSASNSLQAASVVHHTMRGRDFQREGGSEFILDRDYAMDEIETLMPLIGIGFANNTLDTAIEYAMDTITQPYTTPSIATPIQFLQNWLPGIVEIITAKQSADEMIGRATVGSWEDVQIIQQVIALTGAAVPYTDVGNVPLSNWNATFVDRTVVNFELGLRVGPKEEAQAARMRVDSAGMKRRSDAIQLEIQRNRVAFYGYNNGLGKTYGILNDPNLPAYVNNPNGVWASATFANIQQDLLTAFQGLRTQSKGRIDPTKDALTLTIATSCVDYLTTTTDFGMSVWAWLKEFYSNVRIVNAPELDGANGGANVFYLHADNVKDSGTDGGDTWIQIVPATFQLVGIQKLAKGYEEDYLNATAGAFCKRPYAVYRMSGI